MCRIAGIINKNLPIGEIESMVKEMCRLQKHGGPDDEGLYTDDAAGLVLGNRRLSLLDLSQNGHMPMQYANRYHITYNGELYNFKSLKNELIQLGHRFQTDTDTEVILAAYDEWNTLAFRKFMGMYAFALWDSHTKEVLLVRDPFGIKPLYYASHKHQISFASEVRAFAPVPTLQAENKHWPVYMMAYGHIPEPITTLEAVRSLNKGCFFKYHTVSEQCSIQSFSHYSYSSQITQRSFVQESISDSLHQSVKSHLLADAPVGVFLSGGLDSSILSVLAAKHRQQISTLSIDFNEPSFSERAFQERVVQKIDSQHLSLLLTKASFQENLPHVFKAMDMPSCDGINTWFIAQFAANKGFKAVLSGIGADELFGGYPSFNRMHLARMAQHLPNLLLDIAKYNGNKRINRLSYLQLKGIKGLYLFLRGMFTPHEIARQLGAYEKDVWQSLQMSPVFMEVDGLNNGNQASWMEYNLYMQNQLLRDADVMSMQHGVEIRVPFVSNEMVSTAFSIAPQLKYNGKQNKQLLADTFAHDLPAEILQRKKMGFGFPFAEWLKGSDWIQSIIQDANQGTKACYQRFLNGQLHWAQMMTLLLVEYKHQSLTER